MRLPVLKPGQVKEIGLAYLCPDADQIRQTFDDDYIKELADDIALRGIEQPLVVSKNGKEGYLVKHGECRRRAAALAGLEAVPVMLAQADPGEDAPLNRLFDQYAENMRRKNLNAIDLAYFYRRLRDDYGHKVASIPALLESKGMPKLNAKTISNMIRLTTLPDWARAHIQHGRLSPSHGKYLFAALQVELVAQEIENYLHMVLVEQGQTLSISKLQHSIWSVFNDHYLVLELHNEYERCSCPDEAFFYDYTQLTREEKKALKIISIPAGDGDHDDFILDMEAHNRINAEYRKKHEQRREAEEGATSGHTPPTLAPATAFGGSEENDSETGGGPATVVGGAGAAGDRLRRYLHAWLRGWIQNKVKTLDTDRLEFVHDRYCLWLAFNCPVSFYEVMDDLGVMSDHPVQGQQAAVLGMKLANLNDFFTKVRPLPDKDLLISTDVDDTPVCDGEGSRDSMLAKSILFNYTLPCINLGQTCILAARLGIAIDRDYRMDADYAEMYTKAGLYALLEGDDDDLTDTRKMKVGELRAHVVRRYEGTPPDLMALYGSILSQALKAGVNDDSD